MMAYYYFILFILGISSSERLTRYRRDAGSKDVFFLPDDKIELDCFKGLDANDISKIDLCSWKVGSLDYFRDELEDRTKRGEFPQANSSIKCSIILIPENNEDVTCTYELEKEEKTTNYKLIRGDEISFPLIEANGTAIYDQLTVIEGRTILFKCNTTGTPKPPPELKFTSDLSLQDVKFSSNEAIVKAEPKKDDNGKLINCTATQNIKGVEPRTRSISLNVQFAATSETSDFNKEKGSLTFFFKFMANPRPNVTNWEFSKKSDDTRMPLDKESRYKAQDLSESDGYYIASILIEKETNQDLEMCFYLNVQNAAGNKTFDHCPDDSGSSVAVIAGILIAVGILISILIAGFLIYRKKIRATYVRANSK